MSALENAAARGKTVESRKRLEHAIEHLAHVLPGQGPIETFIHHNTLHGFQHLPFEKAVAEASRVLGGRSYLPIEEYRRLFSIGRITADDLERARAERGENGEAEPLLRIGERDIGTRDIKTIALLHEIEPPLEPGAPEGPVGARIEALFERIEHLEAWGGPAIPLDPDLAERVRAAVRAHLEEKDGALGPHAGAATSEIARLCLTVVHDLGPDHLRRRGFEALRALESAFGGPTSSEGLMAELDARDPRRQMMEHAARRLDEHLDKLGPETCHRDLLFALTGEDIHDRIHPQILRVTMAFLDEGLAAWHVAGRSLGFYDAFRKMAEHDHFFELEGLPDAQDALRALPPLAVDAILQSLERLGVPEAHWGPYLQRICVGLPGLSGMVHWRWTHPEHPAQRAHPIDLIQFLAVRMFYEVLFVQRASLRAFGHDGDIDGFRHHFTNHLPELLVRHALFLGELPDFLAERARAQLEARAFGAAPGDEGTLLRLADMVFDFKQSAERVSGGTEARKNAFRLILLEQHLGISPGELQATSPESVTRLLSALDACTPEAMAPLWHAAYEIHYRDAVLHALSENARAPIQNHFSGRRDAQLVFCIDDREESIRRHIEEIQFSYETFGAAGFFGIAIEYEPLGAREAAPLCPIAATPSHRLAEMPRAEALPAWVSRSLRMRALAVLRDVAREVLRNPVSSYFVIDILGFFSLLPVVGRLLFPRAYERMSRRAKYAVIPSIETEVPLDRENDDASSQKARSPRKTHFTDTEQADRVGALLRNIGLVRGFAPFVVLVGHGSGSRNNPHLSAYDCGACGGKHGGPNARVFARMANRAEVRAILWERGIDIPEDTWFVGTEHNTATDVFTYFDLVDMPGDFRPALTHLRAHLQTASERSAHERCRKFESAPKNPSPARAFRHVFGRTSDLSQARPELGHATNAFAIVGPRSISEGVFLDRRSFLVSYDPSIDPEGTILEGVLLAVGPVGAGINLEYYFSTVDNTTYGCGTKVPHNVAGLIGVMEGASGDLRTGLPRQMIEIHEPMRLVMLVAAKTEILGKIYERQPAIRELVGNAWVHLVAMDPETNLFSLFLPNNGFVPWEPRGAAVKTVKTSAAWYTGTLDFLPPALIRRAHGQVIHA